MMKENKLTDEEIVNALEVCIRGKGCESCPYFENEIDCVRRSEKDTLDLIHRLQDENERLTEESDKMFDRHAKENQAASFLIEKRNNEIAELQKRVDELLNRRIEPKIFQCHADALETCPKVEQAVKDTVKEILEYGTFLMPIRMREWIKKRYGVEVE